MVPSPTAAPVRVSHPPRRLAMLGAVCLGVATMAVVHQQASISDEVSPAELSARMTHLANFGLLPLERVQSGQVSAAIQALGLLGPDQAALLADIDGERTRLVWITLHDSDAEDGDVAELRSAGMARVVPLARQPTSFAIPIGPDSIVLLTGRVDGGGGGVTVGVVLPSGPISLPPLSVGQTVRLPVKVQG